MYKDIRNEVNARIREDRCNYQKALIRDFKKYPKRFYGYIRRLQTVKNTVCQLQTSNSTFTNNTDKEFKKTADILCQYFHTVFTKEDTADLTVAAPCQEQFSVSFDDLQFYASFSY